MKSTRPSDPHSEPVYTIGVVARLLKVCPATLRIWERKKLIKPTRLGKNRFYSHYDLERLKAVHFLIQGKGLNLEGAKAVLEMKNCWEIKACSGTERAKCVVYRQNSQTLTPTPKEA